MDRAIKRACRIVGVFLVIFCLFFILDYWDSRNTPALSPAPEASPAASSSVPEQESAPVLEAETPLEISAIRYPVGHFGPDQDRINYVSGEMILRVPKMDYNGPVYSSAEDITPDSPSYMSVSGSVMGEGPGLFGAAQLPSDSNSNVSIAAHRDIKGKEFWDIDKMTDGDYMYLTYKGKEYVYLFEESLVTHDNDWEPVRIKDYGCITLQSCTPIFVASHRIFVTGRLVEIKDAAE